MKLDGLTATKKIKAYNPKIPIIAMTGLAMKGDKERIFEAGCDSYISKPADYEAIVKQELAF